MAAPSPWPHAQRESAKDTPYSLQRRSPGSLGLWYLPTGPIPPGRAVCHRVRAGQVPPASGLHWPEGQAPRQGQMCQLARPGVRVPVAPGRCSPPAPAWSHTVSRPSCQPGPGADGAGGEVVTLRTGARVGTRSCTPARPLSCGGLKAGQSPALPGKPSGRHRPCPAEIPLFLASQLLSDKARVDGRAVGQDNSPLQTTEISQGGPEPEKGPPTPQSLPRPPGHPGKRPPRAERPARLLGEWGHPGGPSALCLGQREHGFCSTELESRARGPTWPPSRALAGPWPPSPSEPYSRGSSSTRPFLPAHAR